MCFHAPALWWPLGGRGSAPTQWGPFPFCAREGVFRWSEPFPANFNLPYPTNLGKVIRWGVKPPASAVGRMYADQPVGASQAVAPVTARPDACRAP